MIDTTYPVPPQNDGPLSLAVALAAALCIGLMVVLGGCTTTRTVGIPTPVACRVALPEDRTFAFDDLQPGSDIFTQVATLLADRRERIDDRRVTRAAAKVCE